MDIFRIRSVFCQYHTSQKEVTCNQHGHGDNNLMWKREKQQEDRRKYQNRCIKKSNLNLSHQEFFCRQVVYPHKIFVFRLGVVAGQDKKQCDECENTEVVIIDCYSDYHQHIHDQEEVKGLSETYREFERPSVKRSWYFVSKIYIVPEKHQHDRDRNEWEQSDDPLFENQEGGEWEKEDDVFYKPYLQITYPFETGFQKFASFCRGCIECHAERRQNINNIRVAGCIIQSDRSQKKSACKQNSRESRMDAGVSEPSAHQLQLKRKILSDHLRSRSIPPAPATTSIVGVRNVRKSRVN